MGRLFLVTLPATGEVIYRCKYCDTDLAYATDIISEQFRCKHGKAYLFDNIVNVNVGEKDDRMMTTGLHSVCDIFCVACGSILGWKYLAAFEKSQRYKEDARWLIQEAPLPSCGGLTVAAQASRRVTRRTSKMLPCDDVPYVDGCRT